MCGILAYYSKHKLAPDHDALSSILHRGPNATGIMRFDLGFEELLLGHQRLSIIDLSAAANQPLTYKDSNKWVIYNGEIYNYLELRDELEGYGYHFQTTSDTEVLLAAYDKWGEACLDKFNGMFAFCVWDLKSKQLFFARDRFGVKPLYYWNSPQGFCIASEIKQFRHLPGFNAMLNSSEAIQYIKYGDFSYSQKTMWEGVVELEPGHYGKLDLDRWKPGAELKVTQWYNVENHLSHKVSTDQEAVAEFRSLFTDAVKLRLRSDVAVGSLLSGGIDSSSISCVGAQHYKNEMTFKAYSACYHEEKFDEQQFINQLGGTPKLQLLKHYFTSADLVETLDKTIYYNDLPTQGRSVFAHYLLYQKINASNVKVILEGQGADEVLAGYTSFSRAYLSELLWTGQIPRFFSELQSYRKMTATPMSRLIKELLIHRFPEKYEKIKGNARNQDKSGLLQEADHPNENVRQCVSRKVGSVKDTHLSRMKVLRQILHTVDRVSMAASVETRLPFMDHRVVEFGLSVPTQFKIKNGYRKHVLREAMIDIVPDRIRKRVDKMGFSSPESVWAKTVLKDFYTEELHALKGMPFINHAILMRHFADFATNKCGYDPIYWRLINLNRWQKIFKVTFD